MFNAIKQTQYNNVAGFWRSPWILEFQILHSLVRS